jgi:hypothetical protein
MAQVVQLAGGDTRFHVGRNEVEDLGGEAAREAHLFDLFLALDGDGHGDALDSVGGMIRSHFTGLPSAAAAFRPQSRRGVSLTSSLSRMR